MAEPHGNPPTPTPQQGLTELFVQYLQRQTTAHAAGLGLGEAPGEVEPFEAVPVQPVDPRLAWSGACAAAAFYHAGTKSRSWKVPAEWPTLVAAHDPATALPFCLGNFPQMVRDLHPFWQAKTADLGLSRRPASRSVEVSDLLDRARSSRTPEADPRLLLAAGVLRLAGQFDAAGELLNRFRAVAPDEWAAAVANEEAALWWHQGRTADAAASWDEQPDSVPVRFNRGLAALFLGRPVEARPHLSQAAGQIPEENAWHHLALLYLALAEIRS